MDVFAARECDGVHRRISVHADYISVEWCLDCYDCDFRTFNEQPPVLLWTDISRRVPADGEAEVVHDPDAYRRDLCGQLHLDG